MPGTTHVKRLRVSRIAARINDDLQVIGQPVAFAHRLASLEPVRGLRVGLPYGDDLPVDNDFWTRIAERRLTIPVPEEIAPKLRRACIPLRYRGTLAAAADVPRLEAHLHPFGVVAMTAVDLHWPEPVSLEQVWQQVDQLENEPATVTVGEDKRTTTLGQAAPEAAQCIVDLLTDPGASETLVLPPHRLVTVISGVIDQPPATMPTANSPLHLALHHLSAGDQVVAEPKTAFVPQWSGSGYTWPAASLLYMLDRGTSQLSAEITAVPDGRVLRTADRHRKLLLLVGYLTATAGLVRAAETSQSSLFPSWATHTAKRLGALFGPGEGYRDWGLAPQALLLRIGATEEIARRRGAALTRNENYPVPDYG
jgi:hypothetical protein